MGRDAVPRPTETSSLLHGKGREPRGVDLNRRSIELPYRAPYDWDHVLSFLAFRAIAGVEACDARGYRRTFRLGAGSGVLEVWNDARRRRLVVAFPAACAIYEEEIARRVRGLFDLDHEPGELATALSSDPLIGPILQARPGIRVPGAWDGFEIAVRAVVGQQVSVAAARGVLSRIAAEHGERIDETDSRCALLFPDAERLAGVALDRGMPRARIATLQALAEAAASQRLPLKRGGEPGAAIAALRAIRGIGEWTAGYVAMRALGARDAFPAGDLVLRRAAGGLTTRELGARAEAWRPWRAYATMLLWSR